MVKKKQCILMTTLILLIGLLFFPIDIFAASAFTDNTASDTTAISHLSSSFFMLNSSNKDIKDIVDNYCSVVLQSTPFMKNDFVYTAKYSAFVYLLCKGVDEKYTKLSSLDASLFKRSSFNELWFVSYDQDENNICSSFQPNCDLSQHIPNLYNMIITDYVNMKQSHIYGISRNARTDEEIEKQANLFSSNFFGGLKICETSDRSYDKTCRTMKSYIKNTYNLLSDVRVFDSEVLLDSSLSIVDMSINDWKFLVKKPENPCSDKEQLAYNPIICGLYGDTTTSFVSFQNLVYNELLYYRLFVGYYLTMLQKNPWFLIVSTDNNYSKIVKKFSSQYIRSRSASSLTFRMLRDMYVSFPFHIGMLMYKEDLDGFAKQISAIATPIYTLYDKLRNVQTPK